jgi:hypothetical protein
VSITYRQSNFGQSINTSDPIDSVSATFLDEANIAHNLGLAFICNTLGEGVTSVTDTYDNDWCSYNEYQTNVGFVSLWVCLDLVGGSDNVVTANGTMQGNDNGGPDIIIAEFNVPANALVTAFQPYYNDEFSPTGYSTTIETQNLSPSTMMVMFIYDTSGNDHEWTSINPPTQVDEDSYFQETNYNTGVMAYSSPEISPGTNTLVVLSSTESEIVDLTVLGIMITELAA